MKSRKKKRIISTGGVDQGSVRVFESQGNFEGEGGSDEKKNGPGG